jgi:hypothetical protein
VLIQILLTDTIDEKRGLFFSPAGREHGQGPHHDPDQQARLGFIQVQRIDHFPDVLPEEVGQEAGSPKV